MVSGARRKINRSAVEPLIRALIDHSRCTVAVFDREMRYLAGNRFTAWLQIPERWREAHRRCVEGLAHCVDLPPLSPPAQGRKLNWEMRPWSDEAGEIAGTIIFGHSGRPTSAHAALRESEQKFRLVFEHSPIGTALAGPDYRFLEANRAFCRLLGYSERELRSLTFAEITPPQDFAREADLARGLFEGRIPSYEMEKRVVSKSGELIWVHLTAGVVRDGEGSVLCALGMVQDITERKRLEQQLNQAQKMEAVGRLAGGVAHDFNNLLTVIDGHTAFALDELTLDSPARPDLMAAREATERAASLARQLLAFSRKQLSKPATIGLNDVLEGSEYMLRRIAGDKTRLVTSFSPAKPMVHADAHHLEQALLNLVINSRDAMPGGGGISIETGLTTLESNSATVCGRAKPGRYATLSVTDTGVGMDETVLSRAFEPFFTTKGKGKGTGLGLSSVFGTVKQSGGYIQVRSAPGQGTTVVMCLPLVESSGG